MAKLFSKLFGKDQVVDREKIGDQLKLSFEASRFDQSLFLALSQKALLSESYLNFVAESLSASCDQKCALSAEINRLQDYVSFYKTAYSDSFNCKLESKGLEEGEMLEIESFILFPLIQNAFHLGYNSMEKYPVKIHIRLVASQLKIEVSNRVNHYLVNQEENDQMRWFKARLNEFYSEKYSLIFNSNSNIFKATLLLNFS